jgi:hypothetical protein
MTLYPGFETDDAGQPMLWVRLPPAEGPNGMIGHGGFEVAPSETKAGLTYDEWAAAARANRALEADDRGYVVK